MKLSLGRTVSTLAVAAGLSLGTVGTAAAAELVVKDARGDVQVFAADAQEPTAAPEVKNGDVLRTVFRHNDRRISVRTKFTDLARAGGMAGYFVRVVTNEDVKRDVTIIAAPNMWRGQATMSRPNGTEVSCDVDHKIAYDTNVLTVSFPRSCVSDPRWVRLGFGAFRMDDATQKTFADDAQISGRINEGNVKLSGRIRRG